MLRQTILSFMSVAIALLCAGCVAAPAPDEDAYVRINVSPKVSFVELEKTLRSHDVDSLEQFECDPLGASFVAHLKAGEMPQLINDLQRDKNVLKSMVVSSAAEATEVGNHIELRDEQFYRWILCKMQRRVQLADVQKFMAEEMKGIGVDISPTEVEIEDDYGVKNKVRANPRARLIEVRPGHLLEAFYKLKNSGLFFSVMQNIKLPNEHADGRTGGPPGPPP